MEPLVAADLARSGPDAPGPPREVPDWLQGQYCALFRSDLRVQVTARHLYQLQPDDTALVRRLCWDGFRLLIKGYSGDRIIQPQRDEAGSLALVPAGSPASGAYHRLPDEEVWLFEEIAPLGDPACFPAARAAAVRQELESRFTTEQAARFQLDRLTRGALDEATLLRPEVAPVIAEMGRIDRCNVAFLTSTIREAGWIDTARFGSVAAQGAVMIALHSGDVPLMRAALPGVEMEWQRGHLDGYWYASLVDRIRLLAQEPLAFGVQAMVDPDGRWVYPVPRDRRQLDANRRRIGRAPFDESVWQMDWGDLPPRIIEIDYD